MDKDEFYEVQTDNYYELLGLSNDASEDEIKQAYKTLALKWHPDKYSYEEKEEIEEKFTNLSEAYFVLGDMEKKSAYDEQGKEGVDEAIINNYSFKNAEDLFRSECAALSQYYDDVDLNDPFLGGTREGDYFPGCGMGTYTLNEGPKKRDDLGCVKYSEYIRKGERIAVVEKLENGKITVNRTITSAKTPPDYCSPSVW